MIDPNFTRVTQVLWHFSDIQHVDKAILSKAADRGTRVHRACEAIVEGIGDWSLDASIQGYIRSFNKWWTKGHKVVSMEQRFQCSNLMITGATDLIIETDAGRIILDIKTPLRPSKTWPLQGSAYAYLARQVGHNITGIQFLKLDKEGKDPVIYEYEDQFPLFKSCLDVYNHFYKGKKNGTPDFTEI